MAKIYCKHCGAEMDSQARFCPVCGKSYGFCAKCGAPHSRDDIVCASCGNSLGVEPAPTVAPVVEPTPTFGGNVNLFGAAPNAATESETKGKAILDEFIAKDTKLSRGIYIATQVVSFTFLGAFLIMIAMLVMGNFDSIMLYIGIFASFGIEIILSFAITVARLIIDLVKVSQLKGKVQSGAVDLDGYIKRYSPIKKYTMFAFGGKKNSTATAYNKLFAASYASKTTGNYVLYCLNAVFTGLFTVAMIPIFIVYLIVMIGASAGGPAAVIIIMLTMFGITFGVGLVPIVISIVLTAMISKHSKTIV